MKNKILFCFTMFLSAMSLPAQAQDVAQLNAAFKTILTPILAQDVFFTDLNLTLQPETDLNNNYVSFMFNASTKQASWSTETSSLILGGNLGLTPVNRTDSRIKSQLSLSLETDVLSFTNYVYNFIQMSAPCGVTDLQNPQNEYSAFSNSICHNLSQPLQASDFNSLKSELAQIVDRIETDLKRFKVAIEEAQLRATDPEVLQGLDYMLVNTDENLAELQNIQVIESNDSLLISLDLSDFVTSMTQTSVATDKVLLNFELTATALHLSLDIDKTMNLQNYTPWIEDIKDHLALIAQGDPEARAQLGYFAQAYLEMAKHFLTIPMN